MLGDLDSLLILMLLHTFFDVDVMKRGRTRIVETPHGDFHILCVAMLRFDLANH